jgi:hypothetical protein
MTRKAYLLIAKRKPEKQSAFKKLHPDLASTPIAVIAPPRTIWLVQISHNFSRTAAATAASKLWGVGGVIAVPHK